MELDILDYIRQALPKMKKDIYPVFTTELKKDALVYFFRHQQINHVNESQLELRIVAKNYDDAVAIAQKLDEALAFESDAPYKIFGNTKFRSVRAGGGCLYQDGVQRYEYTLFYVIKWRTINNG